MVQFSDQNFHSYTLQILTWESGRKGQLFIFLHTNTPSLCEKVVLSELIFGAAWCNCFGEKHREKMKLFGLKAALFQVGKTTSSRSSAGKKGKELQSCNL